jgi:hypothetical protein
MCEQQKYSLFDSSGRETIVDKPSTNVKSQNDENVLNI